MFEAYFARISHLIKIINKAGSREDSFMIIEGAFVSFNKHQSLV